jgi:protein kinase-like protein
VVQVARAMGDLRVGDRLAGYRIERLIGRGGMGVVYLAEDVKLGRKVTLKVLAADLAEDPSFRERFVRESRLAASLDHPHIIPIYEADESDGRLFIAMRYVAGTDLEKLIQDEGPLAPRRAALIIGQVASALDAAHAAGLVHRDVKPANILVAPGVGPGSADHSYLSDFGITKRLSYVASTASGQIMGTVDYVAPEEIEGRPVDGRADEYSLGCVLFKCLSGLVPFQKDNEVAVLWAHLREKPPSLAEARPELAPEFDPVIARAMAKAPEARYERCGDLAVAAEEAAPAGSTTPIPRDGRRRRRRLGVALGVAATLIAAGVVIAVLLLSGNSRRPPVFVARVSGRTVSTSGITAPPGANGIAADHGMVFVIAPDKLVRYDLTTRGQAPKTLPLSFAPTDIELSGGSVFVGGGSTNGSQGYVERVDVSKMTKVWTTEPPLPSGVQRIAVGEGAVWALRGGGTLTRIDPRDGHDLGDVPAVGATDVAAGAHHVWLVSHRGLNEGTIIRLDTATLHATPKAIPHGVTVVAASGDAVWASSPGQGEVIPIKPTTLSVGPEVTTGHPNALVIQGGIVWVMNGASVCRIPIPADVRTQGICVGRVSSLRYLTAIAADASPPPGSPDVWALVSGNVPA